MSLSLPSSPPPPWTLLPWCNLHSDPTHLLCHHCVYGTVASPSSPVAQPTEGWEHCILSPVDLFPLWSSLPLHPTLASGLIHSMEQFPTPTPRSTDSVDSSVCGQDSCCGWKLMPGTLLPVFSWEHSSAPSPSLPWNLLSVEAGLFLLEVASLPMPRNEHISGCQFDLHISASPVPMVQSFHDPCSTHPPAAQLCHSDQARGRGRH